MLFWGLCKWYRSKYRMCVWVSMIILLTTLGVGGSVARLDGVPCLKRRGKIVLRRFLLVKNCWDMIVSTCCDVCAISHCHPLVFRHLWEIYVPCCSFILLHRHAAKVGWDSSWGLERIGFWGGERLEIIATSVGARVHLIFLAGRQVRVLRVWINVCRYL